MFKPLLKREIWREHIGIYFHEKKNIIGGISSIDWLAPLVPETLVFYLGLQQDDFYLRSKAFFFIFFSKNKNKKLQPITQPYVWQRHIIVIVITVMCQRKAGCIRDLVLYGKSYCLDVKLDCSCTKKVNTGDPPKLYWLVLVFWLVQ